MHLVGPHRPAPAPPQPPGVPLRVIVSAGPARPGVDALLEAAVAEHRPDVRVAVLFTEEGLDLLAGRWPARLAAAGIPTSLCARSARTRGLAPESLPSTVAWSSLTTFLADADPGARLWTAFP